MRPLYFVDGFNVLHAVVLVGRERARWWSPENRARLVELVVARVPALEADGPVDVWVIFDRKEEKGPAGVEGEPRAVGASQLQIHHAPNADDYIVERCAELAGRRDLIVVSADRSLRDRAKRHGARPLSPWAFASYGAPENGDPP